MLTAEPFSADSIPCVSDFDCGSAEEWERHCNEWIRGDASVASALSSMNRGTQVILYRDSDQVIGFGSIGETRRRRTDGAWQNFSIIPCVAVQERFRGKPDGCGPLETFACQIMQDLIARACEMRFDVLILDVHAQNYRAHRFYEKLGFQSTGHIHREHVTMILDLSDFREPIATETV